MDYKIGDIVYLKNLNIDNIRVKIMKFDNDYIYFTAIEGTIFRTSKWPWKISNIAKLACEHCRNVPCPTFNEAKEEK